MCRTLVQDLPFRAGSAGDTEHRALTDVGKRQNKLYQLLYKNSASQNIHISTVCEYNGYYSNYVSLEVLILHSQMLTLNCMAYHKSAFSKNIIPTFPTCSDI